MAIEVKITPENQAVSTGSVQTVTDTVTVSPGDNIALDVQAEMVSGYSRQGADMIVQLKNGEAIRIVNFYGAPDNPAHLYLVDSKHNLVAVDFATAGEGALAATYVPQGVAAEFAAAATAEAAGAAAGGGLGGLGAAGIIGGLALVGGGVALAAGGGDDDDFGGEGNNPTPIDTTPPAAATGIAVSAGGTQVTGTAEPGATVRVDTNGDGTPDATGTAGADGRFTIPLTPPLTNGETISVTVRDAAGNTSPPATAVAPDTTPPPAATEVAVAGDGTSVTGVGTPGATINVDLDGDGTPDATGTVGTDGRFTIPLDPPLLDGQTVAVTVVDAAGNASTPVTATAPDTTAPAPATEVAVAADGASVTGVGTPGATINVDLDGDGVADATGTVGDDGSFTIPLDPPLLDGQTVAVTVVDAAGNASTPVTATAPDTTAPAPATEVAVSADGASVSGLGTPGATINVDLDGDGVADATGTVGDDGSFTIPLDPPLLDGQTVAVTVVDATGNASRPVTATAPDTTAPAPATDVVVAADGTSITGLATPGATVNVDLNGDGTADATGSAGEDGRFTIPLDPALIDGQIASVTVVDAAGNESSAVDAQAPDLVPTPDAPIVEPSNGLVVEGTSGAGLTIILYDANGLILGQTQADDNGVWSITPTTPILNGTVVRAVAVNSEGEASPGTAVLIDSVPPAIPDVTVGNGTTIGGTAEPGTTIVVTDGAGTTIGTTITDANGNWSVPTQGAVADGSTVEVVATDPAGNSSPPASIVVDAAPPTAPVVNPSNGSILSGTAEAGSTITVTGPGGTVIGTVIVSDGVNGTGTWTLAPTPPLPDGTVVTVVATDPAGNVSAETPVTVDATPPAAPVVTPTNGDVISGTSDPDVQITLFSPDGTIIGQTTANGSGIWSFDPAGSLPNATVVQAVATDAAGNVSGIGATIVDSIPPATPTVQPTNGTTITGTGAPGSTVIVTGPNGEIGRAVVDADGDWSVPGNGTLVNGDVLQVSAQDAAGNASPATSVTVDTIPPSQPILAPTNGNVIVGVIVGTTDPGVTVTLTANGQPLGVVQADAQGNFTFDPPTSLPNGTVIEAVATDPAGNNSLPGTVTTDASLPSIPTIDPSNGTSLGGLADPNTTVIVIDAAGVELGRVTSDPTGAWSFTLVPPVGDNVVLRALAENGAGTQSAAASIITDALPPAAPVIDASNGQTISGTAEAGTTVEVRDGSGTLVGSAVVAANGEWSFQPATPLPNGTPLSAIATDAAGNASLPGLGSVDALAPTGLTISPTNGTLAAGTAEPLSTVVVTAPGGAVIGTTVTDAGGNWSVVLVPAQVNGAVISATATDAAGNVGLPATVTVDAAAPPAPVIEPTNGTTITGTGEVGATIQVRDPAGTLVGTAVVDANGEWSITPATPVPNGTALQARAVDAAGNISGPSAAIVDSVAPPIPSINPSTGAIISGMAEPGSTIVLTDGLGAPLTQVQADANGAWSWTPATPLPNGSVVLATSIDTAGNSSLPGSVTTDNVAPVAPTILPSNGSLLSGTGEAGDTITLTRPDGSVIGRPLVGSDGNWSLVVSPAIPNGVTVTATATDPTGNVSGPATVTVDAIAPNTPTVIVSNGTSISGTSETDVTIVLQEGGIVLGRVTPDANGNWTFTPTTPLANGSSVTVVAADPSGNVSAPIVVVVDSIAPTAPILNPTNGTTITGTAEAGATITLTNGNGALIGTTTVAQNGTWSFTPANPLADDSVVNATATDRAGNVSGVGTTTVDAEPPAPPVVALSNGVLFSGTAEAGSTITLRDPANNVIGTTMADANGNWTFIPSPAVPNATVVSVVASDAVGNSSTAATVTVDSVAPAAPIITASDGSPISGTADPNTTITLRDNLGNPIGTTTANGAGVWSFTPATPIPNGTIVLAVSSDATGNTSAPGAVTIDSVAPVAPVLNLSNGSVVTGTGEPGTTITLTGPNGSVLGTTTVPQSGLWSITPATPIPNNTVVTATAQDPSGNTSGPGTVTVDSQAPNPPVISPSNGTNLVGTAEPGSQVTLSVGGVAIATVPVDANGNWSFAPTPPLGNGVVVSATAADATGNVSTAGTVTTDTSLPSIPTINPSNGTVVTGTADVGDTLTLTANGTVIGTVVVGVGGTWSVTPATTLPNGTVLVAVARNPQGTDSAAVSELVDSVPPAAPVIDLSNGSIVEGTAEPGTSVTLSVGGTAIATVPVDANGNWSYNATPAIPNGTVVSAIATDEASNVSLPSTVTVDSIAPGAPVISPSAGSLITGTAEGGALVTLTVGGTQIGQVTADANGNWAFTPTPALGNAVVVSATASDPTGNTSTPSTVTIDTVAPVAPTNLVVSADGATLTGSAEAGAQVRVVINGDTANPITVTAGAGGTFTVPFAPPLLAGQDLTVVAIDPSGNVSLPGMAEAPDRAPLTLTVAEAADGFINAAEVSNGIQVAIALTSGSNVGDTITVRFSGQNGYVADYPHVVTAAERASGTVNVTLTPPAGQAAFPEGASTVTATSNSGPVSNTVGFTVDTISPPTPVLTLVGNILTISTEPNTELTVQVNLGGVVATVQVTSDNSGLASVNLLTDLSIQPSWDQLLNTSVSVRGEDQAGNLSNVATIGINPADQLVTIGNFGLDVGLIPPVLGFSGRTEPGSIVRVEVVTPAATVIVAPAVDANGNFVVNLLSPQLLSQLGLSVTGLLNLGAGIGLNLVAEDSDGNESARYGLTLGGAGLSLNIGQVTITGDNDVDILGGTNGRAEIINANGGDDLILNVGSGDRVDGGTGDDTIQLTAINFTSVNGGAGFDTILLANGIDIDYNGVGVGTWTNIERIDLGTGDSGSVLTLTASEVDAITDAGNRLEITGEANDRLIITGAINTGATQTIDGIVYDVYSFGASTVLVEDNSVTVVI